MKWFRWYRGTAERAKFRVIASRASRSGLGGGTVHEDRVDGAVFLTDVLAVWVTLLEDAGNASHWGYVTRDARYIATLLDLGEQEVQAMLDGMIEEEMIEPNGKAAKSNRLHIVNWEKYQFVSDTDPTSSLRQKRYREKRSSNALLTRTDTDSDTERKKDSRSSANGLDERFDKFWSAYPRKAGKKAAHKAFDKALKETSVETILAALERQKPQWRDPQFIPHPATWLNRGQWADELPIAKPQGRDGWV
jgi:hypothetical protein